MNHEQFKQSWGQLKGHLKKHWGKLTEDDLQQIEGDLDKFSGAIEKRYGEMKGEVSKWADLWYARWSGSYVEYYAKWKPAVGSSF
ncbi:MAG: CsbD family protein [Nitrospirae bacterium]|nr:CsbD family protein [Nitrospirota bacterium]